MSEDQAERLAHLRDQLAALESYGNSDDARAAAIRVEIADLEPAAGGIVRGDGIALVGEPGGCDTAVPPRRAKKGN